MLPARQCRGDLRDRNIGRHLGNNGVDHVGRCRCPPRAASRRPIGGDSSNCSCLRVEQRDVGDRIAGGGEFVARHADDGECVTAGAERHLLAEGETGRAVDDHLVMAAHDLAPGEELARAAGPPRLEADDEQPQRSAFQCRLGRLVGDGAGALDAIDPSHHLSRIAGDPRRFGKWSIGAGFDDPEVRARGADLPERVVDRALVNSGDGDDDTEQQAQAETGQHEAQDIVPDVAVSQIHGFFSSATLTARPIRNPLRSFVTATAPSGMPALIS